MAASVTLLPALIRAARAARSTACASRGSAARRARGRSRCRSAGAAPCSGGPGRPPWRARRSCWRSRRRSPACELGFPDEGNDRAGTTTREAYDLVSRGFGPGANGPLLVAVDLRGADAPAALGRWSAGSRRPTASRSHRRPAPARGDAAIVTVIPETSPQDTATSALVRDLRDRVVPGSDRRHRRDRARGRRDGGVHRPERHRRRRLPVFVGAVVLLSFLLLLVAFRAPVIALKAGGDEPAVGRRRLRRGGAGGGGRLGRTARRDRHRRPRCRRSSP